MQWNSIDHVLGAALKEVLYHKSEGEGMAKVTLIVFVPGVPNLWFKLNSGDINLSAYDAFMSESGGIALFVLSICQYCVCAGHHKSPQVQECVHPPHR